MTRTGPPSALPQPVIGARRAFAIALLCWSGFALTAWAVWSGHAQSWDRIGLLCWRGRDLAPPGPPWLPDVMRAITALGGVFVRTLFALLAIAILLLLPRSREAALLAFTILAGWGMNSLAKHLIGRPRPDVVPHLAEASGMSFPSGHSFNSAVVYIAIALAFAQLLRRPGARLMLVIGAMGLSLVIAGSRVWLGVHYPSDAIAGWLGGTGWVFFIAACLYRPSRA